MFSSTQLKPGVCGVCSVGAKEHFSKADSVDGSWRQVVAFWFCGVSLSRVLSDVLAEHLASPGSWVLSYLNIWYLQGPECCPRWTPGIPRVLSVVLAGTSRVLSVVLAEPLTRRRLLGHHVPARQPTQSKRIMHGEDGCVLLTRGSLLHCIPHRSATLKIEFRKSSTPNQFWS